MELKPGYQQTEVGVIPEVWKLKSIESFSALVTKGTTPTTYGFKWADEGVLFLRSECVSDDGLDLAESTFVSKATHAAIIRGEVRSGDVLITITGNVGRVVLLTPDFGFANTNQHIARIRVTEASVRGDFLYHWLSQPMVRAYYTSITTGQAYPQISLRQVRKTQVPLPPLLEQGAIATALGDVDGLLDVLKKLITKKRDLKQAAMQQLLTGHRRLPGLKEEWEMVTAGEIGRFRGGGGFPLKYQGEAGGRYPFFKVSDMNNEGNETFMTNATNWVSEAIRKAIGVSPFPAGSIVFAKVGAAVFLERKRILAQASCIDNNMTAFVLDPRRADSRFIHSVFLQLTLGALVATTALPSLSTKQLSAITLSLPSLTEQLAIAAVLSHMDAELLALEARLAKTRALKQGMMQELLTGRTRLV